MIFCVDFDGTIVEHEYPEIGKPVPFALEVLKELQEHHRLILFTMRHENTLKDAVEYCESNGLKLFGVNENPEQAQWSLSRKVYGHRYIDDAAMGCPLIFPRNGGRPFVDWQEIRHHLIQMKAIPA